MEKNKNILKTRSKIIKLYDIMYNSTITNIFYFFAILPLFFNYNIYADKIYFILFIYFVVEIILSIYLNKYKHKYYIIIDIIATIGLISTYKYLVLARLFRVVRLLRQLRGMNTIMFIVKDNKEIFRTIIILSFSYTVVVSLVVYNLEPETFSNKYYNAFYWAGITLTSVGYGDIYPVTFLGKMTTIVSAFLGIAIIALPTGIIAKEFMTHHSLSKNKRKRNKDK